MKRLLIIILILSITAVSWGIASAAWGYEITHEAKDSKSLTFDTLPDKWMINSMTFNGVTITWKHGYLNVIYDEGITKTEAARQFFDYLKQYVEGEYILIPRIEYEREKMKK